MKSSTYTAFGQRITEALVDADLDQTSAAAKLSARLGRIIKPQTIQYAASKANSSELTADIAAITGFRYEYLAYGQEPKRQQASFLDLPPLSVPQRSPRSLEAKLNRNALHLVPRLDVRAGMGNGVMIRDVVEIIEHVGINVAEMCRVRGVSITSPANLRIITGYGPSMRPTFDHLDQLLVDTGVNDLKIDDVYCLEDDEDLYIKRLQRIPGKKNSYMMISDNKDFQSFAIEDPLRSGFRVHGRVVIALKLVKV